MKKIILALCAVVLINSGCDSADTDKVSKDDVLRIINSLDLPDISFRYKYILDDKTVTLDSDSGPGSFTIEEVSLAENNIFNFWADLNNFDSAFIQCTVNDQAPVLGAVEVQVYTSGKALVIDCSPAGNWQ